MVSFFPRVKQRKWMSYYNKTGLEMSDKKTWTEYIMIEFQNVVDFVNTSLQSNGWKTRPWRFQQRYSLRRLPLEGKLQCMSIVWSRLLFVFKSSSYLHLNDDTEKPTQFLQNDGIAHPSGIFAVAKVGSPVILSNFRQLHWPLSNLPQNLANYLWNDFL